MNRAMILPAAIAAGLHVAVLAFKTPPRPDNPPLDKPEPIDWGIFVPPVEDEEEPVPKEPGEVEPPPAPSEIAPRGAEYLRPDVPDHRAITIELKPTDYIPGNATTLIPPGLGHGPGPSDGPIDAFWLDNVPRALFRTSPNRPPGTGSDQETVTVDFVVGKDGTVTRARVIDSTNSSLEDPCLRAVKRWRFEPGMRKNVPVAFRMQQTFVFKTGD